MNLPHNGKPIAAVRNQPNHDLYDEKIILGLDKIRDLKFGGDISNVDPDLITIELNKFQEYLRIQIDAYPNFHLNDVPINYIPL